MPKLSIGIPVFNGQSLLQKLLDSLLAQTFRDFEILICDNASSDRTPQICREYVRNDSRVYYVRNQRNLGAVANFNRVFELSTAPLFKWAAHDDLYHETYLDACVRLLEENPDVVLAHTGTAFINEKGELLGYNWWFASFAPYQNPKYVVIVTVQKFHATGSGGIDCAPIAHDVYAELVKKDPAILSQVTRN